MDGKKLKKFDIEVSAPRIAAVLSIGLAFFKIVAGIKLGSMSIITSGLDSTFDAAISSATLFFMRLSHRPADEDHPYGHSRIGSVTTLAQGVFLMILSALLAYSATQKLNEPFNHHLAHEGAIITLIASLVTFSIWYYMGIVVKKTGSPIVAADRFHYFTDLGANFLLLLGLLVGPYFPKYNFDSILTFALCFFILAGAYKIVVDSINNLIDHHDPEVENKIQKILKKFHPKTLGAGRLRSRKSGHLTAVDLELITCRFKMFHEIHTIVHEVEDAITQELAPVDVMIHPEPCNETQCSSIETCVFKRDTPERVP